MRGPNKFDCVIPDVIEAENGTISTVPDLSSIAMTTKVMTSSKSKQIFSPTSIVTETLPTMTPRTPKQPIKTVKSK